MDSKSAWEKFESTGMITDYLNYRSQVDMEKGLLPYSDLNKNKLRRRKNNEIGSNRNNNKGNGFE